MTDSGRHLVLGVRVDAVDYQAAVARIIAAARARQPFATSALAVHGVMTGALDGQHRQRLNALDLVVPDGQPVRWALRWLHGLRLRDRVRGPTLMLLLCEQAAAAQLPIYLYGSTAETLRRLRSRLERRFPGLVIAGDTPSAFRALTTAEQQATAREIAASGAQLVFVGLGCPRQEIWVYEHRGLLPLPAIAVGAAFDLHAGNVPEAPEWMQRAGLEWAYRLGREPRRLWRRYLLLNPLYLLMVAAQRLGVLKLNPDSGTEPAPVRAG